MKRRFAVLFLVVPLVSGCLGFETLGVVGLSMVGNIAAAAWMGNAIDEGQSTKGAKPERSAEQQDAVAPNAVAPKRGKNAKK